jgi:hypothetical protein
MIHNNNDLLVSQKRDFDQFLVNYNSSNEESRIETSDKLLQYQQDLVCV